MMCSYCQNVAKAIVEGSEPPDRDHGLCPSLITTEGCVSGAFRYREVPDPTQCTCQHRPIKSGQIQKVVK